MSDTVAQIMLTLLLLIGAIAFVVLEKDPLAVALVGAVCGQGASAGLRSAMNGHNSHKGD